MENHPCNPRKVRYCGPGAPCIIEPTGEGRPITSERYAAALRALSQAWAQRPAACTPEREGYESGPLRQARREVRAAWLEVASAFGIDPDEF